MSGLKDWAKTPQGIATLGVAAVTVPAALATALRPESPPWVWVGLVILLILLIWLGIDAVWGRLIQEPRLDRARLQGENAKLVLANEGLRQALEREEGRVERIHERLLALATDPERALKCSLVAKLEARDASFKVEWVDDDQQHLGLRSINVLAADLDEPGYHGLRVTVLSRDHQQTAAGILTRVEGTRLLISLDAPTEWIEPDLAAMPALPEQTTEQDRRVGSILLNLEEQASLDFVPDAPPGSEAISAGPRPRLTAPEFVEPDDPAVSGPSPRRPVR
ncbi:hypothetical protein [Rubrivirga sp. IMCC43871]|uniref:hypothetical protein n=1 Tax=Rubrivirga sp. IMCC43871 TaxID=3391575 RepID=UPI00398FCD01